MSAPGGEGAKSGLSITEVAGNTVKFKLQKRDCAYIFNL